MDTKGKKILNKVWAKMRKHRLDADPQPPRQFTPPPPIEPPPPKVGYTVGGKVSDQKVRSRYRNPVIRQAPSTDPRFNHKLRRA